METEVDLVESTIEKPLWRSIQALRYKIERREKRIVIIQNEIDDLYQDIAHLRAGCQAGDIVAYKADPSKVSVVIDVDPIDYDDALVYLATIDKNGKPVDKVRQYSSDMMSNYEVIGRM